MKVLTLWEPFATLVAIGAKTIETRSWRTWYRGPLAIHAGKARDSASLALCLKEPFRHFLLAAGIKRTNDLPFGKVLAVVELVECFRFTASNVPAEGEVERAFGDFTPGRCGWRLANVRRLAEPIDCRGQQNLKDLWPDVEARVIAAIAGEVSRA